jgi:predicted metal-binding membrane protein
MSIAEAAQSGFSPRRAARAFVWNHPEWWIIAGAVAAWIVAITASAGVSSQGIICSVLPVGGTGRPLWPAELSGWLVMCGAMMLPLTVMPVRHVAFRSLWRRRHRAIFGFLLGFGFVWIAVGLISVTLFGFYGRPASVGVAGALAIAPAAAWQLMPVKRRALLACHRTAPLAVDGLRADLDCIRYGLMHGRFCLLSCWALMLAATVLHTSLLAMVAASIVALAERYRPKLLAATSLVALGFSILALISGPGVSG